MLIILISIPVIAFTHSGKLNNDGCHVNEASNPNSDFIINDAKYHCHREQTTLEIYDPSPDWCIVSGGCAMGNSHCCGYSSKSSCLRAAKRMSSVAECMKNR